MFFSYSAPNSAYFWFILGLFWVYFGFNLPLGVFFLILHLILLILGLFWVYFLGVLFIVGRGVFFFTLNLSLLGLSLSLVDFVWRLVYMFCLSDHCPFRVCFGSIFFCCALFFFLCV